MLVKENIQGIQEYIIGRAFSSLSYGIYVVLLVSACLIFLKRGTHWIQSHSFIVYMTVCTALITTALACLEIQYYIIVLNLFSAVPQIQRGADVATTNMRIALVFLQRLNYLLSDAVIVWRALVLFPEYRHVKFILIICMIVSTDNLQAFYAAGTFVDCILAANTIFHNPNSSGGKNLNLTMTLPLLITNMISTLLIGSQVRSYHMFNSTPGTTSKARRILILLIESGTIYCLLWPYIKRSCICSNECGDAKYSCKEIGDLPFSIRFKLMNYLGFIPTSYYHNGSP
ncbi:hypothetical protein K435DRAFT_928816 [Dendrothele bispora CBS 962.96]|uniref:Uncharacterized protein n=1 Tax=Dendrothele bispora (strain CBS 962.96) TaxID=1314807 RepID=A0A4S8L6C0_DENBC|nr:hypothetical protein K435DRAFT_928816 [Dendrothele bispora CBS 962.96]